MKRLILILNLALIGAMVIGACATPTTEVASPVAPAVTEAPVVTEAPLPVCLE